MAAQRYHASYIDYIPSYPVFDIFAAFSNLSTQQKLNLCDQLFHVGTSAARITVKNLWPHASSLDADRLIDMLKRRIAKTANAN